MKKKFVLLLIIAGATAAIYTEHQSQQMSAMETYLGYQKAVAAGRSFDQDAAYYTFAKQAEVKSQIDAAEDAEELKAAYLEFTQSQAACSILDLAEETETGPTTRLVFDVTDTCGTYDDGTKVQEIVEMTQEDGKWKIASNETSITQ